MDELEISGKRYLSSRRAAKQYKYHSDYIGQLIRGGKVGGTKVGRAWYVDLRSLATYLGQDEAPTMEPEVADVIAPPDAIVYIGNPPTGEKKIQLPTNNKEPHIEVKEEISTVYDVPIKKVGLTYIPDYEPLFPEISTHTRLEAGQSYIPVQQEGQKAEAATLVSKKKHTPEQPVALILIILGTIVISLAVLGSNFVATTITIEQGKPASVMYSLQ